MSTYKINASIHWRLACFLISQSHTKYQSRQTKATSTLLTNNQLSINLLYESRDLTSWCNSKIWKRSCINLFQLLLLHWTSLKKLSLYHYHVDEVYYPFICKNLCPNTVSFSSIAKFQNLYQSPLTLALLTLYCRLLTIYPVARTCARMRILNPIPVFTMQLYNKFSELLSSNQFDKQVSYILLHSECLTSSMKFLGYWLLDWSINVDWNRVHDKTLKLKWNKSKF